MNLLQNPERKVGLRIAKGDDVRPLRHGYGYIWRDGALWESLNSHTPRGGV